MEPSAGGFEPAIKNGLMREWPMKSAQRNLFDALL